MVGMMGMMRLEALKRYFIKDYGMLRCMLDRTEKLPKIVYSISSCHFRISPYACI